MKTVHGGLAFVGLAALLALPGAVAAQAADAPAHEGQSAHRVSWLAGCWEMSVRGLTVEERWMEPRGGMSLGLNRTIREGREPSYEFLVLRESDAGLVLEAYPSGQKPTEFTATEIESESVTFENPRHDFPRRIRYALRGPDSLVARVDAGVGERGFEQLFERVRCN